MHFRFLVWLFLLVIVGTAGCGPDYEYEKTYPIATGTWSYSDSLDFSFEIEDTVELYNLWILLDHSVDYGYQNLYTRIHTRFPSGEDLREALSLELADKVGRWYGDCNSRSCTLKIPIQQGAFFNQTGTYHITVEQYMRQERISGIQEIGFLVEKTGQQRQ